MKYFKQTKTLHQLFINTLCTIFATYIQFYMRKHFNYLHKAICNQFDSLIIKCNSRFDTLCDFVRNYREYWRILLKCIYIHTYIYKYIIKFIGYQKCYQELKGYYTLRWTSFRVDFLFSVIRELIILFQNKRKKRIYLYAILDNYYRCNFYILFSLTLISLTILYTIMFSSSHRKGVHFNSFLSRSVFHEY